MITIGRRHTSIIKTRFIGSLLLISSFMGCSVKNHSVLYNYYGDLGKSLNNRFLFVDTLTKFSMALPMKGNFTNSIKKRKLSKAGYPEAFLAGTKGLSLLFANSTPLMHTNFRVAFTGSVSPDKLSKNILDAYKGLPNAENSTIDKHLLPQNIANVVYQGFVHKIRSKTGKPDATLIDLILEHQGRTFLTRFWYQPDDVSFQYDYQKILRSSIQPELTSISFDYYKKIEESFLQSPLMGSMQIYQESQGNYLVPIYWLNTIKKELDFNNVNKNFEFKHAKSLFSSYLTPLKSDTIKNNYPFFNFSDSSKYLSEVTIPSDAVSELSALSDNTDLILLNENHLDPYCRYFASKILDSLIVKGYTHLFIEDLSFDDSTINQRGFPSKETGFYASDPAFGNFIRKALNLGFILVPFEGQEGNKNREQNQAKNIAQSISKLGIRKALVYSGHSHIYKSKEKKYMASYLREYTKLRLTSIEQSFNAYISQQIKKDLTADSEKSVALVNKDSSLGKYWRPKALFDDVDLMVIHPEERLIDNYIPKWKLDLGEKNYRIVLNDNRLNGQLLELTKSEEVKLNRLPLLNLILRDRNNFDIYLKPGKYRLTVYNLYREKLEEKEFTL